MKKLLTALALLLTVGGAYGCNTIADFRSGIPTAENVNLDFPEANGQALTADGYGRSSYALEGDTSNFYRFTRDTTRAVNGGVVWILGVVRAIQAHRPTTRTGNTAVWGPFTPDLAPNTWKLTVEHLQGQTYEYVLEGKPKEGGEDTWVAVLSGNHTRIVDGRGTPIDHFGTGNFLIDFDARATLRDHDPNQTGTLEVEYSRTSVDDPISVTVSFAGATDEETGQPITGAYSYLRTVDNGEFEFALSRDIDGNAARESLSIKSRWDNSGAGRSDVRAVGGDLAAEATLNECWDQFFYSTWMAASFTADPSMNYGDATTCAYAEASYSAL